MHNSGERSMKTEVNKQPLTGDQSGSDLRLHGVCGEDGALVASLLIPLILGPSTRRFVSLVLSDGSVLGLLVPVAVL
jgi:hypothetical protein